MNTSTDWSLIISLNPDALREEFHHYVYMNEAYPEKYNDIVDLAKWWQQRSDEEIAEMGSFIMEGSEIWNTFRREVERAMVTVKEMVEERAESTQP